jgi:iron(III) transport system permease protein
MLAFGYLILPALVAVIQTSLVRSGSESTLTLEHYASIFDEGSVLGPLLNTLVFAIGSTLMAVTLGGTLAWLVARTNTPLRSVGHVATFTSFALPFILYTIAWLFVLGRGGPINKALMAGMNLSEPPLNPYTMPVMIFVEGLLWSPLSFLMLYSMFLAMDPSLEESAATSGATTWAIMRRITLPLCSPALLSVALLVFIRSFESFDIPALVGLPGHISVLSTGIYLRTRVTPADYGGASAFAVLLMGLVLAALQLYSRTTREVGRFATISGKAYRPRPFDLGRWRILAAAFVALYVLVLLVIPVALILWASFMPYYTPPSPESIGLITLANYGKVLNDPAFVSSLRNSLIAAGGGAVGVVVLAALASWLVVKTKLAGRRWLDQLGSLPLVFPAIVLGLAYMQLYLRIPVPIYNTLWILSLAYVTRFLPYGMRHISSAMSQLSTELEEAAAASGSGFWTTFRKVVLPLLAPALLGTVIFIFMISTKELSMSVLLSGPRTQVMSVAFFQLWNNGQATQVAAFGVLWAAVLAALTTTMFAVGRRFGLQFQPR